MAELVDRAVERLRVARVRLDPGLSDTEVSRVQEQLEFEFGPEHRELLQSVLPTGEAAWPNWRSGSLDDLRSRLNWPVDGLLFDVHDNGFWPSSWGQRPDTREDRESRARDQLAHVPRLIPLYSHRYLPADPAHRPSPIFSVYQADVIYYGDNLVDYIAHEFKVPPLEPSSNRARVPFWSDLAEGAESRDL
ncbi:SMI1/KNR4 family protein [Jatrophihabitans sp.]|uniref:SMI1/KNR4 family protein n=1 Tax=Jatrophihabitans sp. TaxID=1932789 RepID=UPI002EEFB5C7